MRLAVGLLLCACSGQDAGGVAAVARSEAPLWGESPAEPLDLRAEPSRTDLQLMGELELVVDLYVGAGLECEFEPSLPDGFIGSVESGEPAPWPDAESASRWTRHVLALRPTDLGELVIPPFEVRAGEHTATTAELTITVVGVIGEHGAELEPPAEPFPTEVDAVPWIIGAIASIAALAVFLWWRRREPTVRHQDATPLPPHIKALRELARLRSAPRATAAEVERFYVEVSGVLRVYLEERFGLHAPDRTTEEFLPEVEHSGRLDREQQAHLQQFLQQCDLVKFARVVPEEATHERTFEFAERFVESTRADAPGPAREPVGAAGGVS